MSDYHQPSFYKFNSDSLELIKWITSRKTSGTSILDLGAGSGILGIELSNYFSTKHLTLVEIQLAFKSFLELNVLQELKVQTKVEIEIQSFGNFKSNRSYDLIVCNPPYYLPGHGQKSDNEERQICRSFEKETWQVLLSKIVQSLSPYGHAYFVVKNDPKILKEIQHPKLFSYKEIHRDICFLELTLIA
jgi:tRNA1(Val) A37 N6-methylase TrmN6